MKKRVLAAGLVLCVLAGCNSTKVTTDSPAYGIPVDETSHHALWGLVGDSVHTSGQISRVEVYKGFGDYIATLMTAGLYSPWSVLIWYKETKD